MFNKEFYEQKFQDKLKQQNKVITRLVSDIYQFVKDNEEVVAELRKIQETFQAEQSKSEPKKETNNKNRSSKKSKFDEPAKP